MALAAFLAKPLAEFHQRRMQAQLQHGVDAPPGLRLELLQAVEIPRIDDERLFTQRIGADPQRDSHVGIVEVVRRTDTQVMDALLFRTALELFEMTIESLEFGEEAD